MYGFEPLLTSPIYSFFLPAIVLGLSICDEEADNLTALLASHILTNNISICYNSYNLFLTGKQWVSKEDVPMSGDLYRLIPEEGKHLAYSHDTEGAVRGVYLDDETKKPCGAGEFIPISDDGIEDDSERDSDYSPTRSMDSDALAFAGILALGIGIGVAAAKAYPHAKNWATTAAIPELKKFWSMLRGKEPKTLGCPATPTEIAELADVEEFSENIDIVLNEYQKNMGSEEAQQHLRILNIMCAAMYIASEIRQLSNTAMKNDERLKWRATLEKLATQSATDGINRILVGNTQKLEGEQLDQLSAFMDGALVSGRAFIPIENSRIKEALKV